MQLVRIILVPLFYIANSRKTDPRTSLTMTHGEHQDRELEQALAHPLQFDGRKAFRRPENRFAAPTAHHPLRRVSMR